MKKVCCKIVHKGFYDIGPDSLNKMFELYALYKELRSSDSLQIQISRVNIQFGSKSIRIRGAIYWNMLPTKVKRATTIDGQIERVYRF